MEILLNIHLERLPEGPFLVTSDDLPGLLAQGDTVEETLEIAHDVARHLIDMYREDGEELPPSVQKFSGCADFAIALCNIPIPAV